MPLVPLFPMISIACCIVPMAGLPPPTWLRFFVWLAIGLAIYFPFGRKRGVLAEKRAGCQWCASDITTRMIAPAFRILRIPHAALHQPGGGSFPNCFHPWPGV